MLCILLTYLKEHDCKQVVLINSVIYYDFFKETNILYSDIRIFHKVLKEIRIL